MSAIERLPLDLVGIALVAHDRDDILDELAELLRRPAWMADAACREPHPGVSFFPRHGETHIAEAAQTICAGCLVRDECLAYALDHEDSASNAAGVWGGTTPNGRRRLRTTARSAVA